MVHKDEVNHPPAARSLKLSLISEGQNFLLALFFDVSWFFFLKNVWGNLLNSKTTFGEKISFLRSCQLHNNNILQVLLNGHHQSTSKTMPSTGYNAAVFVYLLNPTAGILELVPDAFPIIGNLDEVGATLILFHSIKVFTGFDVMSLVNHLYNIQGNHRRMP